MPITIEEAKQITRTEFETHINGSIFRLATNLVWALEENEKLKTKVEGLLWWQQHGQKLRNAIAEVSPDANGDDDLVAALAKMKIETIEEAKQITRTEFETHINGSIFRLATNLVWALEENEKLKTKVEGLLWWQQHGQKLRNAIAEVSPDANGDDDLVAAPAKMKIECDRLKAELAELNELRPYWLWRSMLAVLSEKPCDREGDVECSQSSDCITEWCTQCTAKAFLDAIRKKQC